MRRGLIAIAAGIVVFGPLGGIDIAAKCSDAGQSTGPGVVSGQVIDASTKLPLPGAQVWIQPLTGEIRNRQVVVVDERGRFVSSALLPGPYSISASLEGYMGARYGQRSPTTRESIPVEVAAGQLRRDIVVTLWKYASVSGRVVDELGQPVVGVSVRGMRQTVLGGHPTYTFDSVECTGACLHEQTDDRGVFTFSRLVPGDYVFVVPAVTISLPTALLPRSGQLGLDSPMFRRSAVGSAMQWTGGWQTDLRSGIESRDGEIAIRSSDRSTAIAAIAQNGSASVYPTVFHPGVTRAENATVVSLEAGSQRDDVNVSRRPVASVSVSGTASMADGVAAELALRLVPADQPLLAMDLESAVAVTDRAGRFVFVGVTPGNYHIKSLLKPAVGSASPGGSDASERIQWSDTTLSVGPVDVQGIEVSLRTAAMITGRIEYSGQSTRSPASRAPSISVRQADGRRSTDIGLGLTAVNGGTTFASRGGVLPGSYLIDVATREPGWFVRSAMWQGQDISDAPFEVAASDVRDVVVTVTDRPWTTLTGAVRNSDGAADAAATVALFPVEEARWTNFGPRPRRLQEAVPDSSGVFTMTNLPPGDYFVVALEGGQGSAWQEREALRQLAALASRVTLRDGGTATVALRAVRRPR